MNDEQAVSIIKEVAEIGTQTIRKEKWLKKNWRFVAICLTVLLCVMTICSAFVCCYSVNRYFIYQEGMVITTETEYEYDVVAETDKDGAARASTKGGGN